MAAHGTPQYSTAPGNDYAEHEAMYGRFIGLVKWGLISILILLALMAHFLT